MRVVAAHHQTGWHDFERVPNATSYAARKADRYRSHTRVQTLADGLESEFSYQPAPHWRLLEPSTYTSTQPGCPKLPEFNLLLYERINQLC